MASPIPRAGAGVTGCCRILFSVWLPSHSGRVTSGSQGKTCKRRVRKAALAARRGRNHDSERPAAWSKKQEGASFVSSARVDVPNRARSSCAGCVFSRHCCVPMAVVAVPHHAPISRGKTTVRRRRSRRLAIVSSRQWYCLTVAAPPRVTPTRRLVPRLLARFPRPLPRLGPPYKRTRRSG